MKMNSLKAVAAFGLSVLLADTAAAQTGAASKPVGYYSVPIGTGFNLVGVNLHNAAVDSGTITSEAGAQVNVDGKNFSTILSDPAATYILEITSGAQNGAVAEIVSAADGSVTLAGAPGTPFGAATYAIRPAATLDAIFGDSLADGFNAVAADVVYIPDGQGGYDTFFNRRNAEWRATTAPNDTPAKPISVIYSDGLLVERKGAALAEPVVVTGAVKTTPTVVNAVTGFNAVTVSGPAGATLQNSGLEDFLADGFNAVAADVVYVPTTTPGVYDTYFFRRNASWRATTAPNTELTADVPLESAVLIERKGAATAGLFAVPAFYSSL